jgi:hypothetical protein
MLRFPLLIALAALPARALPPGSDQAFEPAQLVEACQGAGTRPEPPSRPLRTGTESWPTPARVAKGLWSGLLVLLAATDLQALGSPGTGTLSPNLNLSASDPSSVFMAQSVNLALARANGTGALPPLEKLNALIAGANPARRSVLDTLTPTAPTAQASTPSSLPPLPSFLLSAATQTPTSDDLLAAQSVVSVSQLTEIFYQLEAIGNQLIADSALLSGVPAAAVAVEFAGFELSSIGFSVAAVASHETTEAAQRALALVMKKAEQPPPRPAANGGGPSRSAGNVLDRTFLYGTWQQVDTTPSDRSIRYRLTPNDLLRIITTSDPCGMETTEVDYYPGSAVIHLSYRHPAGQSGLEDATGNINVKLLLKDPEGASKVITFSWFKVEGTATGTQPPPLLEVLVEQEGDRKAYVRVTEDSL